MQAYPTPASCFCPRWTDGGSLSRASDGSSSPTISRPPQFSWLILPAASGITVSSRAFSFLNFFFESPCPLVHSVHCQIYEHIKHKDSNCLGPLPCLPHGFYCFLRPTQVMFPVFSLLVVPGQGYRLTLILLLFSAESRIVVVHGMVSPLLCSMLSGSLSVLSISVACGLLHTHTDTHSH